MKIGSILKSCRPKERATKLICQVGHLDAADLRLFLGVTALGTKSSIDYYTNRKVDDQTRKYSLIKTIAKIMIGTTTGVLVRKGGIKLGKVLTSGEKSFIKVPFAKDADKKLFIEGVSNTLAFAATVASTLLIDVPLLSKVLSKVGQKPPTSKASSEVGK